MNLLRKIFAVSLVTLLLFPISVEFAHIFAGHEHHFCNHYSDSHFHQKSQDCELFHFHQNSFTSPELVAFRPVSAEVQVEKDDLQYHFLSTYSALHFFRRGPPANVLPC